MLKFRYRVLLFAAVAALMGTAGCSGKDDKSKGRRAADPAVQIERGRYLVAIMDCGGCHTPGALVGQPLEDKALSGSDVGFEAPGLGVYYPPNLTSHPANDISRWSQAEVVKVIRTGERPDKRVLVVMPWRAYASLSLVDAEAVAAYLKSLPPIEHAVPGPSSVDGAPLPYLAVKSPPKPPARRTSRRAGRADSN